MRWEDICVSERQTDQTKCDCCREVTTRATGDLSFKGDFKAWYDVFFSANSLTHPPMISIYVGDWSEDAAPDARWGARVVWHTEGCMLVDWDVETKEDIDLFTPLDRNDILGSDFAIEVWAMVDAVIMKDSRLKELHS